MSVDIPTREDYRSFSPEAFEGKEVELLPIELKAVREYCEAESAEESVEEWAELAADASPVSEDTIYDFVSEATSRYYEKRAISDGGPSRELEDAYHQHITYGGGAIPTPVIDAAHKEP